MSKFEIDKTLIRDLAQLLKEVGLSEIEIESGGHRVRVAATPAPTFIRHDAPQSLSPLPASAPSAPAKHPGAVTSPMVGTAYLAAQPGSEPFVRVGDKIKMGQTLLIVEAMKTMNPIAAPRPGTVIEILVTDGQPIEFAQALMIIE